MSRLNHLIRQLREKDSALADDIEREVGVLSDRRAFGLNFERHTPEAVELPGRRVRRGDKVRILPPRGTAPTKADERLWLVEAVTKIDGIRTATLRALDDETDVATSPVDDLVVVAEFRDPIYPGLVSTGRVERGGDQPFHTVINAENYHALQALLFTHRNKVDCIYIDPPYNTGTGDWIYNDRYVSGDDLYRHSKWLAFMERRLLLARELLKDTGIILVAIGDDEHHRLRMLMDQIFGDSNFLASVAWQGSGKNDARYTAGGVDYMLIFARSEDELSRKSVKWREPKPGLELAMSAARAAWLESDGNSARATAKYRSLLRNLKGQIEPAVFRYDQIDDQGRIFQAGDLRSPNPRPNLQYDLFHPTTGRAVKMHPNGWVYSRESMVERVAKGEIIFGVDESTSPRLKRYLDGQADQVPYATFTKARMPGSKRLEGILGDRRFPYPKDEEVIRRWLGAVSTSDAVVLDFFGGSGTTVEAIMRLNALDGGTRCATLITNNELDARVARTLTRDGYRSVDEEWVAEGVHYRVTRPRISTVTTGVRPDGSTYDDPVPANVEFFNLTYEAPLRVSSHREFYRIAPLLWMRAGSRGRRIEDLYAGWDVAETYGVIEDFDHAAVFLERIAGGPEVTHAFLVTDDDGLFESLCRDLPEHVEPVRLYEAYLRNFELEALRGER